MGVKSLSPTSVNTNKSPRNSKELPTTNFPINDAMSPPWVRKRKSTIGNGRIEANLCSTPYVADNVMPTMGERCTSDNYIFQPNANFDSTINSSDHRPRSLPKPKITPANTSIKSITKRNIKFEANDIIKRRISFSKNDLIQTSPVSTNSNHQSIILSPINTFTLKDSPTYPKNEINLKRERTKISSALSATSKLYYRILNPLKMMKVTGKLVLAAIKNSSTPETIHPMSIFNPENVSTVIGQHLEIVSTLGQGTSGVTRICKDVNTLEYFILKEYFHLVKGDFDLAKLTKEAAALFSLNHSNVVKYIDTLVCGTNYLLELEYCNGLNLREIINKYEDSCILPTENKVRSLLKQILNALNFIHNKGIIHMDIKPENIVTCIDFFYNFAERKKLYSEEISVIDPDNIIFKLADFGHCYIKKAINIDITEGDSRYISKEVLSNSYCEMLSDDEVKIVNEPQPSIDIFSTSLTIAEYCGCGTLPSQGPEWHEIRQGVIPSIGSIYSEKLNQLLTGMIEFDPQQRPNAIQCLESDYLCQSNYK